MVITKLPPKFGSLTDPPMLPSPTATIKTKSDPQDYHEPKMGLIGSVLREEGHIYSIAAAGDLLFAGTQSNNLRVLSLCKNPTHFSRSNSKSGCGMVKAIVVFGDKIFTGHLDGKIRIWTFQGNRIGNLPKSRHYFLQSMNPTNCARIMRRNKNVQWVKHLDAVSCISVDADQGLLYSGSWDKTLKVWRISHSKCLESIPAHDDAVNSVVTAWEGMVITGSADGTVKAWRREFVGDRTKHLLVETLLKQEYAVTALAVSHAAGFVYAASSDGLVRFWDIDKQIMALGGVLRGHKMAVLCLVVAGNLVLSGSADKSICVWRRGDGREHGCAAVLAGHCAPVKCLAVAAEEDRRWIVYSGSLDKSVNIWRVHE